MLQLVQELEKSLDIVRHRAPEKLKLSLQKADLELKVATIRKIGVGGKVEILMVPMEASVDWEKSSTHTFTLSLRPVGGTKTLGEGMSDQLADGIIALATATSRLSAASSDFALDNASVSVDLEVTKEGTLQVVVGGVGKVGNNTHSEAFLPPELNLA